MLEVGTLSPPSLSLSLSLLFPSKQELKKKKRFWSLPILPNSNHWQWQWRHPPFPLLRLYPCPSPPLSSQTRFSLHQPISSIIPTRPSLIFPGNPGNPEVSPPEGSSLNPYRLLWEAFWVEYSKGLTPVKVRGRSTPTPLGWSPDWSLRFRSSRTRSWESGLRFWRSGRGITSPWILFFLRVLLYEFMFSSLLHFYKHYMDFIFRKRLRWWERHPREFWDFAPSMCNWSVCLLLLLLNLLWLWGCLSILIANFVRFHYVFRWIYVTSSWLSFLKMLVLEHIHQRNGVY